MSWDDAEEETKNAGSAGDFLKLSDGEEATIAILGDPVTYTGKPYNRPGAQPTQKVMLRVFNMTTKKPQIWDMAAATFKSLLGVVGTPKKPGKFPVGVWSHTVKRTGTEKNTRYTILPDAQLNDAQKKFLAGLSLGSLDEVAEKIEWRGEDAAAPARRQAAPASQGAALPQDEDLPF
jgi:hypothetical protein